MATLIPWEVFAQGEVNLGEDTIRLTESNLQSPNMVEIMLSSDPVVTWWKGIELWTGVIGLSSKIGFVYIQDTNHGPVSSAVRSSSPERWRLELLKAKALGVHTGMYELRNLSSKVGKRFHFHWVRD